MKSLWRYYMLYQLQLTLDVAFEPPGLEVDPAVLARKLPKSMGAFADGYRPAWLAFEDDVVELE